MSALIREAALGQLIRLASRNRFYKYPEEEAGFQIPFERVLQQRKLSEINKETGFGSEVPSPVLEEAEDDTHLARIETAESGDVEKASTSAPHHLNHLRQLDSVKSMQRTQTIPFTRERMEMEQELAAQRTLSLPIQPVITSTGQILVTWYTTDDADNPQNWSQKKKAYVSFLIWYVTSRYCGNQC